MPTGALKPRPSADRPQAVLGRLAELARLGVDAVEIHLPVGRASTDALGRAAEGGLLDPFRWTSVHAPSRVLSHTRPDRFCRWAERVHRRGDLDALVVHPATAAPYRALSTAAAPISLENMDVRKRAGRGITLVDRLVAIGGLGFTLDLQHAREHDPTGRVAREMSARAGDVRTHTHLAGRRRDRPRHAPLGGPDTAATLETLSAVGPAGAVIIEAEYGAGPSARERLLADRDRVAAHLRSRGRPAA